MIDWNIEWDIGDAPYTETPKLQACDYAFKEEATTICKKIRGVLNAELGLSMKDHGLWRIQCLIYDELKEKAEIQKKLLTNN